MRRWLWLLFFLLTVEVGACAPGPPAAVPTIAPSIAVPVLASATPLAISGIGGQFPRPPTPPASPAPTAAPTALPPTATPHPLEGVTIAGLRARDYPGGAVEIRQVLETTPAYTRYYVAYPSDGLTITGIMQIPPGDGPFPVIILNHGYHDRDSYWAGAGTWLAAEYLNGRGYLTIAPDYRTWGGSDWGPSLFHTGLVADVLNLISSLSSIPQADATRVGLWGHSMGGGITTKILTIDPRIRAAVLYASNSADDADLIARWGRGCLPGETQLTTQCNPGEFVPADLPPDIVQAYLDAAADPAMLQLIAPIHYLDSITAPVQIHIGTADGAEHNATPPEWSYKLHDALLAAGARSELFVYEGQEHLFMGAAWTDMMERAGDLFDSYVKPVDLP